MRRFSSNTTGSDYDEIIITTINLTFFRINSAIIARTAKNKKKADKKKRALERRMSEGDAGSLETLNNMPTSSSLDLSQLQDGRFRY